MKQPKFVIKKSKNNQFYFVMKAGNGEVIGTSETYTQKHSCYTGINSVKTNATADSFEALKAENGQHYFVMKAQNGEVILTSETYTTLFAMGCGSRTVLKYAPLAQIVEEL